MIDCVAAADGDTDGVAELVLGGDGVGGGVPVRDADGVVVGDAPWLPELDADGVGDSEGDTDGDGVTDGVPAGVRVDDRVAEDDGGVDAEGAGDGTTAGSDGTATTMRKSYPAPDCATGAVAGPAASEPEANEVGAPATPAEDCVAGPPAPVQPFA